MATLQLDRPVQLTVPGVTTPSTPDMAPSDPAPVAEEANTRERIGDLELAAIVRTEIDRAIQRNIKGLEYLSASEPEVGLTPKEVIHQHGTLSLYHYLPTTAEIYRVPLLFVHSLVSKPYILDLTAGQSLIEFLVARGFDVYLVDWGTPRPEDCQLTLETYVQDLLPECVEKVMADSGESDLSMVGYCFGGVLSLLYAALNADGPLANLACFTTPVNFEEMGLHRRWSDPRWFDVDRVVDTLGNVPPELLLRSFEMLRPASRAASMLLLWDKIWDDEFVKAFRVLDRWANDHIPFPGECFRQVTKELMWGNRLMKGTLELGGRTVRLENIQVPLLNIRAEYDHIVPAAASRDLVSLVGSEDKQDLVLKGGHVSLVAGGNAIYRLWPKLEAWLAPRSV